MLKMTDESGIDAKLLAVPIDKLSKNYQSVQTVEDLLGTYYSPWNIFSSIIKI